MPPSVKDRLNLAAQFAQTGGKDKARELVFGILAEQPRNADAWYLASQLTDNPSEQINALEQVLQQVSGRLSRYSFSLSSMVD